MESTFDAEVSGSPRWGITVGMASDPGVRPENQDRLAHFPSPFGHVFVLADGMGGHRGGAVASSMAIARLPGLLESLPAGMAPEAALQQAIRQLNGAILREGNNGDGRVRGMGSTLAVLLVCSAAAGPLAIGAHVGDSRIYFQRGARLFRMTRDHTVVEKLIEDGVLKTEDAQRHPQAGILTRALGCEDFPAVDVTPWKLLQEKDVVLLCSDGLSAYVSDDSIQKAVSAGGDPHATAASLVALALQAESKDNISVLICRIAPGSGPPRRACANEGEFRALTGEAI